MLLNVFFFKPNILHVLFPNVKDDTVLEIVCCQQFVFPSAAPRLLLEENQWLRQYGLIGRRTPREAALITGVTLDTDRLDSEARLQRRDEASQISGCCRRGRHHRGGGIHRHLLQLPASEGGVRRAAPQV